MTKDRQERRVVVVRDANDRIIHVARTVRRPVCAVVGKRANGTTFLVGKYTSTEAAHRRRRKAYHEFPDLVFYRVRVERIWADALDVLRTRYDEARKTYETHREDCPQCTPTRPCLFGEVLGYAVRELRKAVGGAESPKGIPSAKTINEALAGVEAQFAGTKVREEIAKGLGTPAEPTEIRRKDGELIGAVLDGATGEWIRGDGTLQHPLRVEVPGTENPEVVPEALRALRDLAWATEPGDPEVCYRRAVAGTKCDCRTCAKIRAERILTKLSAPKPEVAVEGGAR